MSDGKIKPVNFGSQDELRGNLEYLRREQETMKEWIALMASIRKAAYDAHIEQGFTEEQALELCKLV